jgi:hypothetical protein
MAALALRSRTMNPRRYGSPRPTTSTVRIATADYLDGIVHTLTSAVMGDPSGAVVSRLSPAVSPNRLNLLSGLRQRTPRRHNLLQAAVEGTPSDGRGVDWARLTLRRRSATACHSNREGSRST